MNKKLISLVVAYDPQRPELQNVIAELSKAGEVILFTTKTVEIDVHETLVFNKNIGRDLVYKPREWVINNLEKEWDYILYNEGDIFIPTTSIYNLLEMYELLARPFIPSFCRYEFDETLNKKLWIDLHPAHSGQTDGKGKKVVRNKWDTLCLFEPYNLHSGNWLFSREDIQDMIEEKQFEAYFQEFGYNYGHCTQLESAASVPYKFYTKVYPYDLEKVECRHPSKYIFKSKHIDKEQVLKRVREL